MERIVCTAALHKHGGTRRPGVLYIGNRAIVMAIYQVQVAVAVQVGKHGRTVKVRHKTVQRVGLPRAQDKTRPGGCTGVLKIMKFAVVVADDHVGVAVTVEVGKCLCMVGKQRGVRYICQDKGIYFAGPNPEVLAQITVHVGSVTVDGVPAVAVFRGAVEVVDRDDVRDHRGDGTSRSGIDESVMMLVIS